MKTFLFSALALVVGVIAGMVIFAPSKSAVTLGQISLDTVVVNSSTTVATSATVIFSNSTNAQFRTITNMGPKPIYITKKSTSTGFVAGTGQVIFASTTYEMSESLGNLWTGNIYGITESASSTITTSQL